MKNKKGFTLVEMLVSFTLSMILIIILFQLIINLKDLYVSSGIKTELLNKQYLMTNKIYSDLTKKKVSKIEDCNNSLVCIEFSFTDGTIKKLEVDDTNKILSYDGYIIKLDNNSYFQAMNINTTASQANKQIFNANIEIYNDIYKNTNFGINIVYPYSESELTNNYGNKYIPPVDSYISLPYIKSNGSQYINLGYKAKTNTEIRLDIELIENANTNSDSAVNTFIGKDNITSEYTFAAHIGANASQQKEIYYWLETGYRTGATFRFTQYESITDRGIMIEKSGSATFQNKTIETDIKTTNNTDNMTLLGSYSTSKEKVQSFNRYDAKIYGFQIYEGDNLVMNLTPTKSRKTDKIGLYDTVSKQFFISNGTSDFIYE